MSLASHEQLRILNEPAHQGFEQAMAVAGLPRLAAEGIGVLQVNVGKLCNQTCRHCHVDAGPDRRETMTRETAAQCMDVLARTTIPTLDITGGAPELNASFRWMVEQATALGRHVIDRSNLSVLLLPSQADLGSFLAQHRVETIASLPYYLAEQTDAQRGAGVFDKSIQALRLLNELGYGQPQSPLQLNLVYNPAGAYLPPEQQAIEADFRRELEQRYGIVFHHLYTMTNMPISRFLEFLMRSGNYDRYMQKLIHAFNPVAAHGVMCRSTLSVGWDGLLYDCDFNQMLDLRVQQGLPGTIGEFQEDLLAGRPIVTGQHCFGCTAGAGSSCGGAIGA